MPLKGKDHVAKFFYDGVLNQIPSIVLSLYFSLVVLQTGLDAMSTISIATGLILVPYTLVEAVLAYRRRIANQFQFESFFFFFKFSSITLP
jgi:hypothetical protein